MNSVPTSFSFLFYLFLFHFSLFSLPLATFWEHNPKFLKVTKLMFSHEARTNKQPTDSISAVIYNVEPRSVSFLISKQLPQRCNLLAVFSNYQVWITFLKFTSRSSIPLLCSWFPCYSCHLMVRIWTAVNWEAICLKECSTVIKGRSPNYSPTQMSTNALLPSAKCVCLSSRPVSLLFRTNVTFTWKPHFKLFTMYFVKWAKLNFIICQLHFSSVTIHKKSSWKKGFETFWTTEDF